MPGARWLPLESNPDVINAYLTELGLKTEEDGSGRWQFTDIFSFDDELLQMVPKPVAAVTLLFPLSDAYEQRSKAESDAAKDEPVPPALFFMEQRIGNACGTIAIVHALANNKHRINLAGGVFDKFLSSAESKPPSERSDVLEANEGFAQAHSLSAEGGQTACPTADERINLHFITFIHHEGRLWEMDGRRPRPFAHGVTNPDNLLHDAVAVCRKFMADNPTNLNFTAMALSKIPC